MATKEFYGYPREGFSPETRELSNGTIVAHAAQTPFWLTQSGLVFALTKDGAWKRRTVSGLKGHPAYGRQQANGCHSGERYPHLGHAQKNYAAHKLMALAWLGPIPAGWEVDHINGNILDWTLQNIQIVSVAQIKPDAVELAQKLMAEQGVIGSEFEHKGKFYQLQVDETFEFVDQKERYNDAIAAQWRAKAEEQKVLKASVSALTSEMKGLLKSWRLQHPKRVPDSISYTFKVLKKKGDKKK